MQAETQQKLAEHKALLTSAQDRLKEQADLVVKLEEDLLTAQTATVRASSSASDLDEAGRDGSASTMLTVLRDQRDRLRDRSQKLEAKLAESDRQIKSIRAHAESISADNVALVERLRYLQGYRKDRAGIDVESGLAAERKYAQEYEDRTNPFREFQGRQRERRRREMGLLDRTVLEVGDLVFGNKYARLFVCVYLALLHALVMLTLMAHHGESETSLTALGVEEFCARHGYSRT